MYNNRTNEPCGNCGKVNRADYDGLCALCARKAGLPVKKEDLALLNL